MSLHPNLRFKWREPMEFKVADRRRQKLAWPWWKQIAWVLISTISLSAILGFECYLRIRYHLKGAENAASLPALLVMMLLLSLFIFYGIPVLQTKLPTFVSVGEFEFFRTVAPRRFKIADLRCFHWQSAPEYFTLVLMHRRGKKIFIGVPLDFQRDALTAFLCSRGLVSE